MPEPNRLRIAVDAMSGDEGIRTTLEGVLAALDRDPELELLLVGNHDKLTEALGRISRRNRRRLSLVSAESVLPMDIPTARALRQGEGSSMHAALELTASGEASATVSAGSTGALMALSRQLLGMLPAIERPALMAAIPASGKNVWILDLGANVGVDARRLHEFAQLGSIAAGVLEHRAPRIGLLNIGHEPSKGPDVLREAARLVGSDERLDYAGFVEADEVFAGAVDLVVCDGFAGNILLKSAEGAIRLVSAELEGRIGRGLGRLLLRRSLESVHDRLDPARHNGALLLGIKGTVIKSHGGACARGFASALSLAALEARRSLVSELERQLWASY